MRKVVKGIKRTIKPFYNSVKGIVYSALDWMDIIRKKNNPLIPPRKMIFIGNGDYKKIGLEFATYFKELGNLTPHQKVLDVGCGIGRMAVPLVEFMSKDGAYTGFDIVKSGIDWCKENITMRYPNFNFDHANVYNAMYNPEGSIKSSEYKFKYETGTFDFIFLTSVFTHMFRSDVENYISEISRVLKSGGTCLMTMFLLNEESEQLIKSGYSSQSLKIKIDDATYTVDEFMSESSIGYKENYVRQVIQKNNLILQEPIYYGNWCNRTKYKSYQDIIIVKKI